MSRESMVRGPAPDAAEADLEVLRRAEPGARPARRPILPRITLWVLALGLLGAALGILVPVLFPPRIVRLAEVTESASTGGTSVAGSDVAGWIEADPFPTTVRPLVKGVVETLEVLEGQRVEKGKTVIARLRSPDLENAVTVAEATLALREAELAQEQSHLDQAVALLEQRLEPRAERARFEGELAVARASAEAAREAVEEAAAVLAAVEVETNGLEEVAGSGGAASRSLEAARHRVAAAESARRARAKELASAQADVARLDAQARIAREADEDPRALATEVCAHETHVARARAARDLAAAELAAARRNLDLLVVTAPSEGVVLRLMTTPGSVAGPMEQMRSLPGEAEGTTSTGVLDAMVGGLVALYDPARLQARIGVPLAEIGGIGVGTEAEVRVSALPGRAFKGRVTRVASEAIILNSQLQFKVRIEDPDPALRPEMNCKARFRVEEGTEGAAAAPRRWLVPPEAVRGEAVWVLDPRGGGRARRVPIRAIGPAGDRMEVEGDLGLSLRVILDPVEDDERVRGAP